MVKISKKMAKKEQGTDAEAKAATDVETTGTPSTTETSEAKKLLDSYGLDEIYENCKGEFFTNKNLALLSVGGKTEDIITHKRE